jgi:hypothetical protein
MAVNKQTLETGQFLFPRKENSETANSGRGTMHEQSEAENYLNKYHELFEKYERRFEGNEFGIPAYVLANFYAGWTMECEAKEIRD